MAQGWTAAGFESLSEAVDATSGLGERGFAFAATVVNGDVARGVLLLGTP